MCADGDLAIKVLLTVGSELKIDRYSCILLEIGRILKGFFSK